MSLAWPPPLGRFLLFSALVHTPLFVPVVVLFWQNASLSMLEIYTLQAIYAAAVVLLEVPTGMIADRIGKRESLCAAAVFFASSFLWYARGDSFFDFAICEIGLALASSLLSGADAALLFELLKAEGREAQFRRWLGTASALQMCSFAVSNVAGGLLGGHSLRLTLALSAVGPILALAIVLTLPASAKQGQPSSVRAHIDSWWELVRSSLRFIWRQKRVQWMVAMLGLVNGSAMWLLWMYQPYFSYTGLPIWSFGLIFALFNLYAAAISASAHRIRDLLGEGGSLLAIGLLQLLPLPLMASLIGPASFLLVLGQQSARGLARPILTDAILAHTWADKRATVLSLGGLGGRLFFGLTAPLIGLAMDRGGLESALWLQAALLASLLLLLGVVYLRLDEKYHRIKPEPAP